MAPQFRFGGAAPCATCPQFWLTDGPRPRLRPCRWHAACEPCTGDATGARSAGARRPGGPGVTFRLGSQLRGETRMPTAQLFKQLSLQRGGMTRALCIPFPVADVRHGAAPVPRGPRALGGRGRRPHPGQALVFLFLTNVAPVSTRVSSCSATPEQN